MNAIFSKNPGIQLNNYFSHATGINFSPFRVKIIAMKWTIAGSIVILFVILVSCQKENGSANTASPVIDRKFRFQLYTNQDFSGDASVINFSIFIKNANHTLYDSVLAPLLIKDIPGVLNKLVIEKTVTESNNSNLTAGFRYEIENVGNSWYIDTSKAGNLFKIIDFAFQ